MTIKDEYKLIYKLWEENVSYGDLYALIVDWISKYKTIIRAKNDVNLLSSRLFEDTMKEIVEDFIYADYCELRDEMMK